MLGVKALSVDATRLIRYDLKGRNHSGVICMVGNEIDDGCCGEEPRPACNEIPIHQTPSLLIERNGNKCNLRGNIFSDICT